MMTAVSGCGACAEGNTLDFAFTMAFQPIVDLQAGRIYSHEALVRGTDGAGAASILSRVNEDNRYAFDQACRVRAIEWAAKLGITERVNINFMPNAVYEAENCIRKTLSTAKRCNFPIDRLVFEVTEGEEVTDKLHLATILAEYRRQGFKTAIDDFGAGYAGLNLLAEFQPDIIKLDMELTRKINADRVRRSIVRGIMVVCEELDLDVIAEGIETLDEMQALADLGITKFQGYFFAKPVFEGLASVPFLSSFSRRGAVRAV